MDYRSCMKLIGTKVGKNNNYGQNSRSCIGTGTGMYRYTPSRSQPVPVQVQVVPVHPNRMQPVPVQVRGVPVQVCPKCSDCVVFAYLSLNSYTVRMRTLLND